MMNGPESYWGWRSWLAGRAVWLLVALVALLLGLLALWPESGQGVRAAEVIDTAVLRSLDDQTHITLSGFRYNRATQTYLGTATVTNTSTEPLAEPLYLVVAAVSPAGATVVGAPGLATTGQPYYDLTTLLPGGTLAAGASTSPLTLQLKTPTAAPLQLDLHVYGKPATINHDPIANAGPDQTVRVGASVPLDGSRSSDDDGDALTFTWSWLERPAGSTAVLSDPTAVNPSFAVDRPGTYEIQLVVNDGHGDSAPDSVRVSTRNSAPVANAGPDQTAFVGATVPLDGSRSSDVDGDPLTFTWSWRERPDGSNAALSDANAVNPHFELDRPGVYVVQLVVNDGTEDSVADTVTVTTVNSRPVANAGPDRTAFVGATVPLDGSGSHDVDFNLLTYHWSLTTVPPGSTAALSDPTSVTPSFRIDRPGAYVAQLVVNDGSLDSVADTVTITTLNSRPAANAGPDQTATVGKTVILDGRGSSDVDGDPLGYQWSLLKAPDGSTATLSGATTDTATLVPDLPGLYIAQLIVSDGTLTSDPDTAKVEIEVGNQPPEITSTPPGSALVGVPYGYDVEAKDPEGGAIRFTLTVAPPGMTIDPASGLITWTPMAGDRGDHPVSVEAKDPQGAVATQSYTVTVYADCTTLPPGSPGACTITGLSTHHAPPGERLTVLGTGFDPDPTRNTVTVGGVQTQVTAGGADSLTVRVPLTATDGTVTVATPRGTLSASGFSIDRAQNFTLVASPAAVDVLQGSRRAVQLEVGDTGTAAFQDVVELTASNLPAGVTLDFLPPALTVGRQGTVLVAAANNAPPGHYTIEIRGTGYTSGILQTRSTAFMLEVKPGGGTVTGITGRFVTPEGAGIPGVIIRAEPVGAYGTSLGQTVTDAAGEFLLRNLPVGILVLRVDATPADPGYPIFPVSVTVADGVMSRLNDRVLRHQPPAERFSPIVPGSPQEQVITDPRYPGVDIHLPAGTSIIGWDGVPKTRMAIERIEPDRLPVDPPPVGAKSYYQLFFGTPMGGMPSNPILVTLPNELGLDPGEKADLYYFDGAPTGEGLWKTSGTGTVSADGSVIVTDPGSGIPRFCGVCGLSCFIRQNVIPSPPCPDCDPQGPPQKGGKPITLGIGMELPSVVDLQIDGVMPITIGRVYNPWNHFVKNQQLRPSLGHGWYFNYDVVIYGVGGAMRVVMPGNGWIDFTPDGNGNYVAPNDLRFGGARLTSDMQLVFKDGRVWRFTQLAVGARGEFIYFLTEQRDGKGNSLRIERNSGGRPTTITAPGRSVSIGIGGNGYIEEIRDELGRRVQYSYNSEDRLAQVTAPDGGVTGYSYEKPPPQPAIMSVSGSGGGAAIQVSATIGLGSDGPVYLKTMTFPGVADPLVLDYSDNYRVVRETLGNQMELRFSYELSGTCATKTVGLGCAGPNGPTVDSWENRQAGWRFFGGQVAATRVTDANGNGFKVRFNGAGLGIELEDALGQITRYERDSQNRITAVTDPLGRTTRYEYDGNNNITRIVEPGGRTTDLSYHPTWNRVTAITRTLDDGTPVTYRFEYTEGEFGLLRRAIDPLGNVTEYGYTSAGEAKSLMDRVTDPLGRVTRLTYNGHADLAGVTDPLGNAVALQRDVFGRLLQVTDALGASTRSEYNVLDQITRIIDANGGQTRFTYDAKRDPVSVVDPLDRAVESYVTDNLHRLTRRTDAAGAGETYEYDRAGRLISAVDRKGQQVRLSYDALNRVTRLDYADGNVETRDYDAVGRLVRITDVAGTIAFEYDNLDRLVKETTEYSGRINSVAYRYDALDRLVERTVNGADPTTYTYDLASRLQTIAFRGATISYEWDQASRLRVKTLPNGTRQEYAYDAADRLLEIRFVKSDGSLIDHIAYQYDANGRRIGKTTGLPSNNETPITGTYDQANRMTSVTFMSTGETCTLEYDANGNLTAKVCPGGRTTYTWDARDRLTAINGPDVVASFRYDALGRRIERRVNGAITGYLYDGVQAIAEFGVEDAGLLTGLAIDEALGRFAGSGTSTLLTDALGSVVAEARADESIATQYGYSPYGETAENGQEIVNSSRYTGREFDSSEGYFYRARYYHPKLKRFISEDPIRLAGSLNFSAYVGGDPVLFGDPLGLKKPDEHCKKLLEKLRRQRRVLDEKLSEYRSNEGPRGTSGPLSDSPQPGTSNWQNRPWHQTEAKKIADAMEKLLRQYFNECIKDNDNDNCDDWDPFSIEEIDDILRGAAVPIPGPAAPPPVLPLRGVFP
jgi:RHS repeat-associated protein